MSLTVPFGIKRMPRTEEKKLTSSDVLRCVQADAPPHDNRTEHEWNMSIVQMFAEAFVGEAYVQKFYDTFLQIIRDGVPCTNPYMLTLMLLIQVRKQDLPKIQGECDLSPESVSSYAMEYLGSYAMQDIYPAVQRAANQGNPMAAVHKTLLDLQFRFPDPFLWNPEEV